jgi:FemAB-related protein (PEP-CTERM system-associated)
MSRVVGVAAGLDDQPRLSITVRTDAPSEACEAYVAAHPLASGYHRPAWLAVIERAFGHRTAYLTAQSKGRIAGVLPLAFFESRLFGRFTVSVPFLNYGGVLAEGPEVEQALLDRAIEETRASGGAYLELRHTRQLFPALQARRHKVAMRLALESDVERQWAALDRKVRNQVRKAEKSGLDVESGGADLVDDFYEVFARNMRDLGTPVYGVRFFREALAALPGTMRVFVVRLAGRPIAASIVHAHGSTLEVPWASALREHNPLCPNILLYWHMLRSAVERGARTFDFGRSTPGEGTFHFKRQWGAQPHDLVWEYWTSSGAAPPDLSPANPKFAVAISLWQRLPVPVATTLGPHIVKHIP